MRLTSLTRKVRWMICVHAICVGLLPLLPDSLPLPEPLPFVSPPDTLSSSSDGQFADHCHVTSPSPVFLHPLFTGQHCAGCHSQNVICNCKHAANCCHTANRACGCRYSFSRSASHHVEFVNRQFSDAGFASHRIHCRLLLFDEGTIPSRPRSATATKGVHSLSDLHHRTKRSGPPGSGSSNGFGQSGRGILGFAEAPQKRMRLAGVHLPRPSRSSRDHL